MSVPVSGRRAFRTAWAAFWWRRCSGGAVGATEGLFEEGDAHALGAADLLKRGGVQGFPLTISAKRASRTEMTLPSWARPATA